MGSFNILQREQHDVSRSHFSQHALKVLNRLRTAGYDALLVGGALRDILRGRTPRDFDVVTNADIEQIKELFRNSKVVGKRFPIVHTYFGNEVIEVSSFKSEDMDLDRLERIAQDASRRDYTVNAIYYDIETYQLLDPEGALEDLKNNIIVPIGPPDQRIQEDPIRILRAIKLKAIHGLEFDPHLRQTILQNRDFIRSLGAGRKYEELTRVFLDEDVEALLKQFQEFGLTGYFWPAGSMLINEKGPKFFANLRETIAIKSSRGSFARSSHTMLWFRLFIESGVFDPTRNPPAKSKEQFQQFIEPLGMPFRTPILDTLHGITALHTANSGRPAHFEAQAEVMKLLEYYVQFIEPQLRKYLRDVVKPANKGRRKSRFGSAPQAEKAKPLSNEDQKPRRKRRRRRRKRPISSTEKPSA